MVDVDGEYALTRRSPAPFIPLNDISKHFLFYLRISHSMDFVFRIIMPCITIAIRIIQSVALLECLSH